MDQRYRLKKQKEHRIWINENIKYAKLGFRLFMSYLIHLISNEMWNKLKLNPLIKFQNIKDLLIIMLTLNIKSRIT